MNFLKSIVYWMQESWVGELGREVYWFFPAAEVVHFFGLCLMMGALLVIDLRLLGFAKRLSLHGALKLVPIVMIGLVLNTLSGIVFLCTYPENYWPAMAFWLKLGAIAIGCTNALWFKWMEGPRLTNLADTTDVELRTKVVAAVSLLAWTVVIIIGRFLPFVSVSTS